MRSVQQYQRALLLRTSAVYALLVTAVPLSLTLHDHLASVTVLAAGLAGACLVVLVLRVRDLGSRRGFLASWVVLTGPAAPWVLARRTRRWRPVLLLRPTGRNR